MYEEEKGLTGHEEGEQRAYSVWKSVWTKSLFILMFVGKKCWNCFKDRKQKDKSYWFIVGINDRSLMNHADQY